MMNCIPAKLEPQNCIPHQKRLKSPALHCSWAFFLFTGTSIPKPSNNNGPPILRCEVENAIRKTPNGKAPGEDGITAEMIKILDDFGIDKLLDLYNNMYNTGHIPEELLRSIFITIPKKQKASECADFRTISLMPHTMKIFLKIILERISHKLDKEIGEEQFGFRAGSGTREGIFCMHNITQKHIQVQKDMYACFIDYSKAFDRIHHINLIECLEKVGIDGKDIQIIGNLYWRQKAAIRVGKERSDYTDIQRGVRQGCVLSPYLFNIYTEFIFRESQELTGVNIGGENINSLRYADDTVLMTNSKEDLNELVQEVKHHSRRAGLEMNAKKTKAMVFSKTSDTPRADLTIDGIHIEQVEKFKYLGATITEDGRSETEIKTRTSIAKEKFSQMKKIVNIKTNITQPKKENTELLHILYLYVWIRNLDHHKKP